MSTLAEYMIVVGAENRPSMLDKTMYNSWQSHMLLYLKGKKNGRLAIESIKNGPLVDPTIEENGQVCNKKYAKLTEQEKLQDGCDVQALNIVLQGLLPDVYALVNHYQAAKDIQDRFKLIMQGTEISYQERESVMSSASSAVTYTSVYTDSELGRAFWGADDEEISEGGIPRVIILGYDRLPIQPVAPPSPDYIPGQRIHRHCQFLRTRMSDEHEFSAKEQPLPPVDSPTAESPGYVTKSDPEEDLEEFEDDETEDGPVDYPMDGGDDGDDDDGDSSRDDANDEDEDDEDDEEEEHLALADSAIVVPVDEPVFPSEGTEPVIPPPSTDITIGARITRLARCMAPPAHSSPLLPSSGCPTQFQTLRIESTQALIDAVTTALPAPPLPPLPPSLYIPPPVDRKDDIPESEQPPRKRLCLSTLGSRYEVRESYIARPTRGRGIDYGFVSTVDVKEGRQGIRDVGYGIRDTWVDPADAVPEIAPVTLGDVNTRVTELAELHEHDTHDLYTLLEDA
ncbi:hypothetical protein Tco_0331062 [Tanacetum coccineum]